MEIKLNIYVARFNGHWLDGIAIVIAADKGAALVNLRNELAKRKLADKNLNLTEERIEVLSVECPPNVKILHDGDY